MGLWGVTMERHRDCLACPKKTSRGLKPSRCGMLRFPENSNWRGDEWIGNSKGEGE